MDVKVKGLQRLLAAAFSLLGESGGLLRFRVPETPPAALQVMPTNEAVISADPKYMDLQVDSNQGSGKLRVLGV